MSPGSESGLRWLDHTGYTSSSGPDELWLILIVVVVAGSRLLDGLDSEVVGSTSSILRSRLVGFSVSSYHRGLVSFPGATISLEVSILLAVAALDL